MGLWDMNDEQLDQLIRRNGHAELDELCEFVGGKVSEEVLSEVDPHIHDIVGRQAELEFLQNWNRVLRDRLNQPDQERC